jgi:hypothetical protein
MHSIRKYLTLAFFVAFSGLAILAFMSSKPSDKNARVYKTVQQYSPYYLDKRLGGLTIKNKEDKEFKEKPNNMTLFQEFERLEKEWAKTHLKLSQRTLIILDNNSTEVSKLQLKTPEELSFVKDYYEVQ